MSKVRSVLVLDELTPFGESDWRRLVRELEKRPGRLRDARELREDVERFDNEGGPPA
jgi:hypothetical protein